MAQAGQIAAGAVGFAALLIFLNYQYVLVKPSVVRAEPATGVSNSQSAQPGAGAVHPSTQGTRRPANGEGGVGAQDVKIARLEAELARLRDELAQLRPTRLPEGPVQANAGPTTAATTPGAAVAPASLEQPCPHPCGNGTCNRMLGECSCPPHLTGANCAEPMFPACSSMWGFSISVAPCGLPEATFPITCECAEQCDAANVLMRRMCFEHRPPDDPGRHRTRRWTTGSSDERWTMTIVDSPTLLQLIYEKAEASRRAGSCNNLGILMPALPRWLDPPGTVTEIPAAKFNPKGPGVCVCQPTHWGAGCDEPLRSLPTCLNRCNGHGSCVNSVCRCTDGYWGADCSLRVNPAGGWSTLERAVEQPADSGATAKVYVYELPGRFTTWLAAQSNAHEWTHSWWFYDNDISLHQRFLASPYRTANPEEADFFYVPLYRSLGAYTAGWGPGVVTPKGWRAFLAAVGFVNRTWPYFRRRAGNNHMMVITCDVGYGMLGEFTSHGFVHRSVLPRSMQPMKFILQWGGAPTRKGHDLVIPPRTPPQEVLTAAGTEHPYRCALKIAQATGPPLPLKRRTGWFFYFRGKIILDNPVYSQGVRQKVYRAHHMREGYMITDQSTKAFYREMSDAVFCFAPTGWGWGQRVFEAILSGCIPVVMQSDNAQPFEHILPWSRFAVMLNESHIPELDSILKAIPQRKIESMQRTLSCVWPRLTFFSSPSQREQFGHLYRSDAFEMMMLELSSHVEAATGNLTPSHAWHNMARMLKPDVCSCAMVDADLVSVPL